MLGQIIIVLLLILLIGYLLWLLVCYIKHKEWSFIPCYDTSKIPKVKDVRLKRFGDTQNYWISWSEPFPGNDDPSNNYFKYYVWNTHGDYSSSTTNPPPVQTGTIQDSYFALNSNVALPGTQLTIVIDACNSFACSADNLTYFTIPSDPLITNIQLQGVTNDGTPINMPSNPILDVDISTSSGPIVSGSAYFEVYPHTKNIPPHNSQIINCDPSQSGSSMSCPMTLQPTDYYGGTVFIPRAQASNSIGKSPYVKSPYSYEQNVILPGQLDGIEMTTYNPSG